MKIRSAQMAVFEANARRNFEQEMYEHVREFSPELARAAGDKNVVTVIAMAIDRAERYGLTNRGPVRLYLEMMLTFGSNFDTDPALAWAGRTLSDQLTDQKTRAERLHSLAQDYLARVAGPNDELTVAALRRVRSVSPESFEAATGPFDERMLRLLRTVYPEKCAFVGQAALDALFLEGKSISTDLGLTKEIAKALVIGTMFAFGHGVTSDPLYPWVGETLRDERIEGPNTRANRLYRKFTLYVDHMIDCLR